MKEEKLEQLRRVFEEEIRSIILAASGKNIFNLNEYIKNKANQLVYEVKIRINNK